MSIELEDAVSEYPVLYKRNTNGKIQTWQVEVQGNAYRTISGQKEGKKTTSKWTECKAKNIGKVNEVTPEEQAHLRATAQITLKLEQGRYHLSIDTVDDDDFTDPMLAADYKKYIPLLQDILNGDWHSQPKLDGMRCIVKKEGMFSRQGKPIVSAPHVHEAYGPIFEEEPDLIIDGELYTDILREDFNQIMSLCKKTKPTPEDLAKSREIIQHWAYDIVEETKPFTQRIEYLGKLVQWLGSPSIVLTPTHCVTSQEDLNKMYEDYLAKGIEGQILRRGSSLYQMSKRPKDLLKRKEFIDEEYEIIELQEGQGNWSGYVKRVELRTKDGKVFGAGIKGNQEYLAQLLIDKDQYPGCLATVRYQNLTPDGIPRFPVVYDIHGKTREY